MANRSGERAVHVSGGAGTETGVVSFGAVFKSMQIFIYGFSFAVFGCLYLSMMAGRHDSTNTLNWMADNMARTAMAQPLIREGYVRGGEPGRFQRPGWLLGQDDHQISGFEGSGAPAR